MFYASADRQSPRARHAQRVREVGIRRRRSARSSLSSASSAAGQMALVFGDARGNVLPSMRKPARSGRPKRVDAFGGITGAPVRSESHHRADLLFGCRPRRRSEIRMLRRPRRGSRSTRPTVTAVDRARWRTRYGKVSSTGVKQRGPSGAPIWSTPSVDIKRGLVYSGTGRQPRCRRPAPATRSALDLATGELKWTSGAGSRRGIWAASSIRPVRRARPTTACSGLRHPAPAS
jgi:hypothetical protein